MGKSSLCCTDKMLVQLNSCPVHCHNAKEGRIGTVTFHSIFSIFSVYFWNIYIGWNKNFVLFLISGKNHKMKLMEITSDLAGPYICYCKCSIHSCSRAVLVNSVEKQLTTLEKSGVSSFHRDLTPSRLVVHGGIHGSECFKMSQTAERIG